MKRHASPHQPSNGALRKTREREWRKRKQRKAKDRVMNGRTVQLAMLLGMIAAITATIAIAAASDGTNPAGYADAEIVGVCNLDAFNVMQCEALATPDGSPIVETPVIPTATANPNTMPSVVVAPDKTIEIDVLPRTGAGTTATETVERYHTGFGHYSYRCGSDGRYYLYDRNATWYGWTSYYGWHHQWSIFPPRQSWIGYC
jgi:hypothetical protein